MFKDPRKLINSDENFFLYYRIFEAENKLDSVTKICEEKDKNTHDVKDLLNKSKSREVQNLKRIRDLEKLMENTKLDTLKLKEEQEALEEEKNFFLHV